MFSISQNKEKDKILQTTAAAPLRVCIIGGSIGGLAAALSFHRLGAHVKVFEKSPAPFHGRGGSIGYVNNPLWEKLRGGVPMVRRGHRASRVQGAYLYGDLWAFLFEGLPDGMVTFDSAVDTIGDPSTPTVLGEAYDLCVIADGGWSALRERYFSSMLRLRAPVYAGYNVWRFRVERTHLPGWDAEGEYSDGGHHRTILLKVAFNDGREFLMGGTAIAAPEGAVAPPDAGAHRQMSEEDHPGAAVPQWYLPWYKTHFGGHVGGELYRAHVAAAAHGKITAQPQYEFFASKIVLGKLLLLGDAAHMASPRTGAGAHTAVLDGLGVYEALAAAKEGKGVGESLSERMLSLYEPAALQRAATLYARSREVSTDVVAPGWQRNSEL